MSDGDSASFSAKALDTGPEVIAMAPFHAYTLAINIFEGSVVGILFHLFLSARTWGKVMSSQVQSSPAK